MTSLLQGSSRKKLNAFQSTELQEIRKNCVVCLTSFLNIIRCPKEDIKNTEPRTKTVNVPYLSSTEWSDCALKAE